MTSTAERQATNVGSGSFDPLTDLDGMWTVDLAARYLPIPGMPLTKYECWDGHLFMTPYESVQNSYGEAELIGQLRPGARAAGYFVCGPVNLMLGLPGRWIQPDVTVLDGPVRGTWVSSEHAVLVAEFVSPGSIRRDRIDKPTRCAEAGIPWYMTVDLDEERGRAAVELFELKDGRYHRAALNHAGSRFEMTDPFQAGFDPIELLMR